MGDNINKEFEKYQQLLKKKEMKLKNIVKFDNDCKEMKELEKFLEDAETIG